MRKTVSFAVAAGIAVAVLAGCQSAGTSEANAPVDTNDAPATGEAPEAAAPTTFSLEIGDGLGIEGVSPELIAHPDGGYLLLATGLSEDRVYRSEDGVSFTPDPTMRIPRGSDYSLLQKPDGTWLLYYVSFDAPTTQPGQPPQPPAPPQPMDPKSLKKVVMVSSSTDLNSFPDGVPTGIRQDEPGPAWGVPDTYIAPDGTYRMMWVDMPEGEEWEVLRTATSQDGITFTPDEGYAITDGYVDPFMLKAEPGDWVLLLSTTPAEQRLPQKVYVATSTDGLIWDISRDPLLEDSDRNYLDPSAVETAPGEWLVVISTAEKANAISGPHEYVGATLRR
jgi:hypothetical protein